MLTWTVLPSPLGPLQLESTSQGLTRLLFAPHPTPVGRRVEPGPAAGPDVAAPLALAAAWLAAYWDGDPAPPPAPPLDLRSGSPFQQQVWQALTAVPFGTTTAYGEVARALGLPAGSARAVGLAAGRNPVALVVPCHRVVGSDGSLTGFSAGLDRKRWLLDHEARHAGTVLF